MYSRGATVAEQVKFLLALLKPYLVSENFKENSASAFAFVTRERIGINPEFPFHMRFGWKERKCHHYFVSISRVQ